MKRLQKLLIAACALLLVLGLAACNAAAPAPNNDATPPETDNATAPQTDDAEAEATPAPTAEPTAEPTPTPEPTPEPTPAPTPTPFVMGQENGEVYRNEFLGFDLNYASLGFESNLDRYTETDTTKIRKTDSDAETVKKALLNKEYDRFFELNLSRQEPEGEAFWTSVKMYYTQPLENKGSANEAEQYKFMYRIEAPNVTVQLGDETWIGYDESFTDDLGYVYYRRALFCNKGDLLAMMWIEFACGKTDPGADVIQPKLEEICAAFQPIDPNLTLNAN